MKILEIVERGRACLAGLPTPTASARSLAAYQRTFERMLAEDVLDPLRPGDARDTYNQRRASLHAGAWRALTDLMAKLLHEAAASDLSAVQERARELEALIDRLEPALDRDPPLAPGATAIGLPASRWTVQPGEKPRRGKNAKRRIISRLPRDWLDRLWEGTPQDWPYRAALAVIVLAPCRPEELAAGEPQQSPAVTVRLVTPTRLRIAIMPAKGHDGRYGTGGHVIVIDPTKAGPAAAYLASLCSNARRVPVLIPGKNIFRKSLARLGKRVFPELSITITPYVVRAQVIADYKATFGAGGEVAAACGHCTDRTQSRYGRVEHGRRRNGIIKVLSRRPPRVGHASRASTIGTLNRDVNPVRGA
jgi:hypothetical protein